MVDLVEFVRINKRFVAAHRGASGSAPENSIEAFKQAIACGAVMVEADIQITADMIPIVFHDDSLGRTAPGIGNISEMTYDEIKHLSVGEWFSPQYQNEKLPLLSDLLQVISGKAFLGLEVKTSPDLQKRLDVVLDIIKEYNFLPFTVFASFDYCALSLLKEKEPNCHIGAVKLPGDTRLPSELKSELGIDAYICSIEELNDEIAADIENSLIFLGVYEVDSENLLKKALTYPVQAIGTNYPCLITELLEKYE